MRRKKAIIEAEAKAEATRIAAEAEADANAQIAASLTPELIDKIMYGEVERRASHCFRFQCNREYGRVEVMLMKKIYVDIISEKERKLHQLQADAESAVDIVTRAISGLELVNQEIEDTKSEIDEYISRLTEQRDTLVHNQKRNCVVIKNFSKLLAVDEAEEESETAS